MISLSQQCHVPSSTVMESNQVDNLQVENDPIKLESLSTQEFRRGYNMLMLENEPCTNRYNA